MDQELLAILKKLPKERYRKLTEALGNDFSAKKIRDGLAAEGVEISEEQAAYLESVLRAQQDMELTDEQADMVAGGKGGDGGCV